MNLGVRLVPVFETTQVFVAFPGRQSTVSVIVVFKFGTETSSHVKSIIKDILVAKIRQRCLHLHRVDPLLETGDIVVQIHDHNRLILQILVQVL